jgi:hypothetical protein
VRESVSGFSPALAQLAALDTALGDPISAHTRRIFAVVPRLLQKRFEFLIEQYRQASAGNQREQNLWHQTHAQFRSDMQGLLLAEIDTRLLPVLGLIEALDEHEES